MDSQDQGIDEVELHLPARFDGIGGGRYVKSSLQRLQPHDAGKPNAEVLQGLFVRGGILPPHRREVQEVPPHSHEMQQHLPLRDVDVPFQDTVSSE
jgi:hypothetical protein